MSGSVPTSYCLLLYPSVPTSQCLLFISFSSNKLLLALHILQFQQATACSSYPSVPTSHCLLFISFSSNKLLLALHIPKFIKQKSALTATLLHFPFQSVHLLLKLKHFFICILHQNNIQHLWLFSCL